MRSTPRDARFDILQADVLPRKLLASDGAYSHVLDDIEAVMDRAVGDEALEFL